MPSLLCLTIRFLQPYCHGRGDGAEPEWPPSPLRVFQALVAAAAGHWNERMRLEYAVPALRWLEEQLPPLIVAGSGIRSEVKYRLYVPDNVADKVAKSWSARREASIADYRTEKDVRPTHLVGDTVHYLFPLADGVCPHFEVLAAAARSITHVGWGIDMVAGNALVISEEEAAKLPGRRWRPVTDSSAGGLRVPVKGTLNDLGNKHTAFLNRVTGDGFVPVPPLSAFKLVGYRRDSDPAKRPIAVFQLLKPDADGYLPFDPVRRTHVVAGMVRHAMRIVAKLADKPEKWIDTFVLGHGDGPHSQARADGRFAYLPLPSITPRKVESIRRVLVAEPAGGSGADVRWAVRALSGADLVHDGRPIGLLAATAPTEPVVQRYVRPAETWVSVTPVVLPGHDEARPAIVERRRLHAKTAEGRQAVSVHAEQRTERLLRKAIRQAGFPPELADHCDLEWRSVGFLAGVELAERYIVPPYLDRLPRYHVRITWRSANGQPVWMPGPVAVGAGRYCGLGLFAAGA